MPPVVRLLLFSPAHLNRGGRHVLGDFHRRRPTQILAEKGPGVSPNENINKLKEGAFPSPLLSPFLGGLGGRKKKHTGINSSMNPNI